MKDMHCFKQVTNFYVSIIHQQGIISLVDERSADS
jgi:hypothetical protein